MDTFPHFHVGQLSDSDFPLASEAWVFHDSHGALRPCLLSTLRLLLLWPATGSGADDGWKLRGADVRTFVEPRGILLVTGDRHESRALIGILVFRLGAQTWRRYHVSWQRRTIANPGRMFTLRSSQIGSRELLPEIGNMASLSGRVQIGRTVEMDLPPSQIRRGGLLLQLGPGALRDFCRTRLQRGSCGPLLPVERGDVTQLGDSIVGLLA